MNCNGTERTVVLIYVLDTTILFYEGRWMFC